MIENPEVEADVSEPEMRPWPDLASFRGGDVCRNAAWWERVWTLPAAERRRAIALAR
jgi:hypothetical protein